VEVAPVEVLMKQWVLVVPILQIDFGLMYIDYLRFKFFYFVYVPIFGVCPKARLKG
jgi:hypothetical protein